MPTVVHEVMGNKIEVGVDKWITQLQGAVDAKISNAARSFVSTGSADVEFPFAKGESDSKSPDKSFMPRECERQCIYPTVVVEIGFSQSSKDLREKAETYIRCSKREIRVVIGVDMDKMYRAEKKNEDRLKRCICQLESLMKRTHIRFRRGGGVDATCVQNKKFRDEKGNPIGSAVLRLPLQDFICKATEDSSAGNYVAPQLELLAGDLCMWIDEAVVKYRTKRNRAVKKEAEDEKQKQKQQQADARKNSKREQGIGSRGDSSRTSRSEGPAASTGCTRPGKFVKG
ncbi:hypothetical protein F4801DRAFT_583701 [Xylaria longipes]|nr:hypothetical protein F4801DRAFT_583701 [Xylaria longipes]